MALFLPVSIGISISNCVDIFVLLVQCYFFFLLLHLFLKKAHKGYSSHHYRLCPGAHHLQKEQAIASLIKLITIMHFLVTNSKGRVCIGKLKEIVVKA